MAGPNTIVVATDFSNCATHALETAGRLASQCDAALVVVHVVGSEAFDDLANAAPFSRSELEAQFADKAKARLREELVAAGIDADAATIRVEVGHPLKTILTVVDDVSADLLVVGAFGEGRSGHAAGVLATQCARQCSASVLLVAGDSATPKQNVVACVDFSEQSDDVVAAAAAHAEADGARLVLLHVHHNPFEAFRWGIQLSNSSEKYAEYRTALQGQLERMRDGVQKSHPGLTVDCELRESVNYGRAVIEFIGALDSALAVLAAKKRSKLAYTLLGSTPEKVLRETPSSVLIVRSS